MKNDTRYCSHCNGISYHLERCIFVNGKTHIIEICDDCGERFDKERPFTKLTHGQNIDEMPIRFDNRTDEVGCEVCGNREAELHHWAPHVVFGDEYNDWPTSYLCIKHHEYWADKIANYFKSWYSRKRRNK